MPISQNQPNSALYNLAHALLESINQHVLTGSGAEQYRRQLDDVKESLLAADSAEQISCAASAVSRILAEYQGASSDNLRVLRPQEPPRKPASQPVLEIPEEFQFRVLDGDESHAASGKVVKLVGRRLIARVSEYIQSDTCVRIDSRDAFVLGVTLGCWREGPAVLAAVELHQVLAGLSDLAGLREQETRDWAPALRQKA